MSSNYKCRVIPDKEGFSINDGRLLITYNDVESVWNIQKLREFILSREGYQSGPFIHTGIKIAEEYREGESRHYYVVVEFLLFMSSDRDVFDYEGVRPTIAEITSGRALRSIIRTLSDIAGEVEGSNTDISSYSCFQTIDEMI